MFTTFAQNRQLVTLKINEKVKIDGQIDSVWLKTKFYTDFVQFEPYNGSKPMQQTYVGIIYDDDALYIAAIMHDSSPDSILKELSKRDEIDEVNTDIVGIILLPFNDKKNAFLFKVSASGVQNDLKINNEDEDVSWDAVWSSAVQINDTGWVAEFKIPYSSIRFPKKDVQEWGINVWRHNRRYREWSSLAYVNNNQNSFINESALLTGIKSIRPPLRLSLFPYLASYLEKSSDNNKFGFNVTYGADIKYGINESFTLDMVLIPDFGQVESDDVVLNLSAFETQYDEKRQFFTEGTELFNKAGLFYSRRIGNQPQDYDLVYEQSDFQTIVNNPSKNKLLNAVKVSGRNANGLGIGVFNAFTAQSIADYIDTNMKTHHFITQPFTNYNIIVFDQTLKNRSNIGIINTNLYNKNKLANVTAVDFNLEDKNNIFRLSSSLTYNKINLINKNQEGFRSYLSFGKIKGNFRFSVSNELASKDFNINDMGYNSYNNYMENHFSIAYNKYNPFGIFLNFHNNIGFSHIMRLNPYEYAVFDVYAESRAKFKNYLDAGLNIGGTPIAQYDFYEPRVQGYKFRIPPHIWLYGWLSPDYRKKFVIDLRTSYNIVPEYNKTAYSIDVSPRIRINDKLFFVLSSEYEFNKWQRGFVEAIPDSAKGWLILFGRRNVATLENSIYLSYIFSKNASFSIKARHYWSTADYKSFYELQNDGTLKDIYYTENKNLSFDALTIDAVFAWQFAPGSEVSVVWKNAVYKDGTYINPSYFKNFEEVLAQPAINSFSIKVLYYLDYNYLKKSDNY